MLSISSTAHAEPFRDGVIAYQKKEYQQALNAWIPLAKSGHVLAQTLIGSMYAYGEGVERSDENAFKWLSRAAKSGSSQAQYNLAILYENGYGTTKDNQQARKWFKAAADQGRKDAAARYTLLTEQQPNSKPVTSEKTETKPSTNDNKVKSITTANKPTSPKQRIHLVLNKNNDNELLGPPSISNNIANNVGLTWVEQQPKDNYTIQLAASIEPRLIKAFKKHIKLSSNYADTTSIHNGRKWHALIYGSYTTVREAKQAIAKFPDSWKTWQPWIKAFSTVKHIKE